MVWGAIVYTSRSSLVRIDGTLTSARYISGVLLPVALPFRLARYHTDVTTVDELLYSVEATWLYVSVHAIQSLFDSIPRRITAVITARGGGFWY
ncbi:hypothetical protein TNCV_3382491 [Trichonephila clavipes]|nr:hypothetical protein TNCV_3382491 [Trichonephila clavipes]